jgi:hypothetical protein
MRIGRAEPGEARHQPRRSERGQDRHLDHDTIVGAHRALGGFLDLGERRLHIAEIFMARRRELDAADEALEHFPAQEVLKEPDLPADRTLRHMQLGRRCGE